MTTRPGPAGPGSDPGSVQWRSDHDYSASWTESRFVDNWAAQDGNEIGGERTPPMCSLCGLFIRPPHRSASSSGRPDDTRQDDRYEPDASDHEMDDNFHSNRFEHIADDRSESDNGRENSDDDDDDDDGVDDGAILTPADVLQFFMNHHQSSVLLSGADSDDDADDVRALERHREAVERHMIEVHGAPGEYALDPKDFLPPRPNPSLYVSVTLPLAAKAAARTPDEIFDEVGDRFADLKVGAVPRKTMHGWARVLAQGLGRETRSLRGNLGELLHLCYELHWRKAHAARSP